MSKVRALVALEDIGLHQVVEDILEITFREVKTERAMSTEALLARLKEQGAEYDLVLLDLLFDSDAERSPLEALREEAHDLLDRLVIVVPRSRSILPAPARDFAQRVGFPFSLDEFMHVVRTVCERTRARRATGVAPETATAAD